MAKHNPYVVSVLFQVAGTDEDDALNNLDRILLRTGLRVEDEPAPRLAELGLLYVNAPEDIEPAPYSLDERGNPVAEA